MYGGEGRGAFGCVYQLEGPTDGPAHLTALLRDVYVLLMRASLWVVARYEHSIRVRPVASYGRRNPVSSQVEAALLIGPRKQLFTHTGTTVTPPPHISGIHVYIHRDISITT